tara:strand:- start:16 stop:972 length:957 start_codon:yes stop_codon:yes gene_type:complete
MPSGYANVNDINIWWEDFGNSKDPSVLLIMGANANCLLWTDEFIGHLVDAGFHVVRFDNRDVGKTTWINQEPSFMFKVMKLLPISLSIKLANYFFSAITDEEGNMISVGSGAKYDLNNMADDAVALMDHLSIGKAHLVGASMGGMIAQVITLDYPDRVLSLTPIMSTPGIDDPELSGMKPSLIEGLKNSMLLDMQGKYEDGIISVYRELAGSRFPFDEEKFREELKPIMSHGHNPFAGHAEAVGASPNRRSRLTEIKVPTLVIHGTEDAILPYDHGEALAEGIENSELMTLEGVGHEIPQELNDEICSRIVNLFYSVS